MRQTLLFGSNMSENWHVTPTNDLRKHLDSQACWCNPKIEVQPNGNKVIVHNSLDGREKRERGEKSN